MNVLIKIWDWFNGNKTLLGTLCLALAPFFPDYVFLHQALLWVGGVLGGVGLAHKLKKGVNNT